MPLLAFVLFDEENKASEHRLLQKSGFLKGYFGMALFHFINRKKFNSRIKVFSIENDVEILTMELPFKLSFLNGLNRHYLTRYISRICMRNSCARCYIPKAAKWSESFPEHAEDTGTRTIVFKSLLIPVINRIYRREEARLENLEIAILCGEDLCELPTMVKQLEPYVKYIHVASSRKELVESMLEEISCDSGMPILTSGDFNSILKTADIAINMGSPTLISAYRIQRHTLVVNFDTNGSPILQGVFPTINGVEFFFPEEQYSGFGMEILRNYTKAELTEILMALKTGLTVRNEYNDISVSKVLKIFNGNGCRITGVIGRRGVLRPEDVNRAIQM